MQADSGSFLEQRSTSGLVLSRHIEDAIGINVKDDVDLGDTTRRRRDS